MSNYKTAAQRYNDRMDKIFAQAKQDWPTSGLHGPSQEDINAHEAMAKPCPVCGELTTLDAPSSHCLPF